MLLTMGVSLYTSRVILNALGIEDYGIYNVVGGVVAMFGILSGSLSSAISRFITFELGKGDLEKLKRIFCTSVNIQVILIAIITILMETIGIWFLNNKMVIPEERLAAANWVFQFSVVTFALNLLSVPYNAVIIAHEKMSAFAYISIVDVSLKLIVAFIIAYNPFDRLVYYGLLIMIVGLINRMMYAIYSKRHFEEATYRMIFDKGLMKEMFGFAGWNTLEISANTIRIQGGTILLNLFFDTTVNAARAISSQVLGAVSNFVTNFMTAVNPQIIKLYASGDNTNAFKLVFKSAKFSYYIFLLPCIPIIFNIDFILNKWLGIVPNHASTFIQLTLFFAMVECISRPLTTLALATGNIKKYMIWVSSFEFLNIPFSYLVLNNVLMPEIVYIVSILIAHCCLIVRLCVLHNLVKLDIFKFFKKVYLNVVYVTLLSILPCVLLLTKGWIVNQWSFFILTVLVSIFFTSIVELFIGFNSEERIEFFAFIKKLRRKRNTNE